MLAGVLRSIRVTPVAICQSIADRVTISRLDYGAIAGDVVLAPGAAPVWLQLHLSL